MYVLGIVSSMVSSILDVKRDLWLPGLAALMAATPAVGDVAVTGLQAQSNETETFTTYLLLVADAISIGIPDTRDGSYADELVRAHEYMDMTPELVGQVWTWTTHLPWQMYLTENTHDSDAFAWYMELSRLHGRLLRVPVQTLNAHPSITWAGIFSACDGMTSLPEGAKDRFWASMDNPHVRNSNLHSADDTAVLGNISKLSRQFASLFQR